MLDKGEAAACKRGESEVLERTTAVLHAALRHPEKMKMLPGIKACAGVDAHTTTGLEPGATFFSAVFWADSSTSFAAKNAANCAQDDTPLFGRP
jgi:hypothetical protein